MSPPSISITRAARQRAVRCSDNIKCRVIAVVSPGVKLLPNYYVPWRTGGTKSKSKPLSVGRR